MSDLAPHWRQLTAMLDGQGVDVVLDVGANRGQYAGYLRQSGWAGRIVSFEPLAEAHAALAAAAADDPAWTAAPAMALGAAAGEAVLNVSAESDMSSLRDMRPDFLATSPTSEKIGEERVTVATLDQVFAEYVDAGARAFLKIDTQGFEREVLDGAQASLARIAGIQIELSLVPLYEGEPGFREMLDRLDAAGFEPYLVIPGYYSRHLGRMLQFDAVLFRREPATP